MPVIRTQDKMQELTPGDTLVVTCTDPGVKNDIPAWCRINGHEIIKIEESGDDIIISIRAGEYGQ
jgi:tRNA 2-thiouridine synthesizing protein A